MSEIKPYAGPAGGWGALKSVGQHLREQRVELKGSRTLLAANQPEGFDCPGCAWPDSPRTAMQFCENGAKAVAAETTAKRATPERVGAQTVSDMAGWSDYALEDLGRLTHPLRYDAASDRYVEISWDEAFALMASHLRALPSPDQALFYTSGRTSNEAAFLWQLFVREYGTNNLPDCSNMCHEPSGVGLKATIGVGKGTVTLDDFALADAIFSFGHNPGSNHPRMLGELRAASRRGARIVAFNPLRERGLERFTDPKDAVEMATLSSTDIASHYYQPRIGGDLAVLTALAKCVLERDALDRDFIATHTTGFEAFAAHLRVQTWQDLELASGLTRTQLEQAAEVFIRAERSIICWGMGITQHRHSVANVEMIAALLLMRGQIGKPGAGVCPVRGHSNVQGDRTMGINERPPVALLDRLEAVYGFTPPRHDGFNTVEAIAAMADGRAQVFIALGGNFAAATPDTAATQAALQRCALTVHISTKLNRSHVVRGRDALVLPCLGRTELDLQQGRAQAITVEDSMSMVHRSTGRNEPASAQLLSEPEIVARLAEATLPDSRVRWRWLVQDHDRIRDEIAQVIPGFDDFNARVAAPGGFLLPNGARDRVWATASGRAEFHVHELSLALPPADDVLLLATIRSHDQYNTTVYGDHDRYRGVKGERRVLFISPADLERLGLQAGTRVAIDSLADDGVQRRLEGFLLVPYDLPAGCVASYYPETNPLVPLQAVALGAGTPASKSLRVRLRAMA
ncbi:MAG: CbbBc protein [Roseateles depolymerans]|uniref:CbbBc protein n=1 Tax=Roseateles depolymerans TaxID=76731 RepID=A0A2W5G034_9BURK|nr:MAG: CbbBc protein [Roseateles depolymerans]